MRPAIRGFPPSAWPRAVLLGSVLSALTLTVALAVAQPEPPPKIEGAKDKEVTRPAPEAGAVEARFIDSSSLKLTLREQQLVIETPYGRLQVPVADVHRVEFATRVSDEDARKIGAAIENLSSTEFPKREEATVALMKLGVRAYPALAEAASNKDPEVARRVREVLEQIRQDVPEELLEVRKTDVVYTGESKFAGRIVGTTLKATTFQFGDVTVKLADLRALRSPLAGEEEPVARGVIDAPPSLVNLQNEFGKTFNFRVTGGAGGTIWGTDVYTIDSTLGLAVVHAGILKPGQTGVVRVKIVAPPPMFVGSTRNGVTSHGFGSMPGYEVKKVARP